MSQLEVISHEEQLVAGIVDGKRKFENQFIEKYRPIILSQLRRLTSDECRAEDLTHDTLILVLQKLRRDSIREPEKLTSYLLSTARFVFYGWLRRMDNQVELKATMDDRSDLDQSISDSLINEHEQQQLALALKRLKVDRDREIITRRYLVEQTKFEICEAMQLSRVHYDRVISRARHRLQSEFLTDPG
jgi:RNA polymerase sigma factor (sigma-70 family)